MSNHRLVSDKIFFLKSSEKKVQHQVRFSTGNVARLLRTIWRRIICQIFIMEKNTGNWWYWLRGDLFC